MGIGGGYFLIVGFTTMLVLIGLWVFPLFDSFIHKLRETRTYHLVYPRSGEKMKQFIDLIGQCNLRVDKMKQGVKGREMVSLWILHGRPNAHDLLVETLIQDEEIIELQC
jgi:hypothetical protein